MRDYYPDDFRLITEGSAGNYYVAWGEGRRTRRRSMGTKDKDLARERMKHFVARMCAPKKAEKGQLLMSAVLSQYWDDVGSEAKSGKVAKRAFEFLLNYYRDSTVADITKKSNKQCEKDMRAKGWSNATINRYRNFLRSALNHAVDSEDLVAAPKIPMLQEPPARNRWLTRKEAGTLLREARHNYPLRLFILIGLYSAARHEAILSLTWDRIDFEKGVIDFRRYDAKGNLLPETKKRRPNAPAAKRLMTFLWYAWVREQRLAKLQGRKIIPHVITYRGEAVQSVLQSFGEACGRAGLVGATPHTMKHTRITWLLRARVPVFQVSHLTATSVPTIMKVYGHHIQEDLAEAANAVRSVRSTHFAPIPMEVSVTN
jgi:integrase